MTQETVKALTEKDLSLVITWAQDELKARAEQRKQDAIAKIKELAGAVGVSITINGRRGRPPKAKTDAPYQSREGISQRRLAESLLSRTARP